MRRDAISVRTCSSYQQKSSEGTPVYIVSNIRVYRDALGSILKVPGITIVGAGPFNEASLIAIASSNAKVVVLDCASLDRLVGARSILELSTHPNAVLIGVEDREDRVLACAEVGILGCVTCEASIDELRRVIHDAGQDRFVCSSLVAGALVHKLAASHAGQNTKLVGPSMNLTPRQRQVASLLGQGLTNKEIGRSLSIRYATVRNHVHTIYEKLNVKRRTEAVALLHVKSGGAMTPSLETFKGDHASVSGNECGNRE